MGDDTMTIKEKQIKALQDFIDSLEFEHSKLTVTDIKGYDRQYEYWTKYDAIGYNSCVIFKLHIHSLNTDLWVCLYQGVAYRDSDSTFTGNYSTKPDDLLLDDTSMYYSNTIELSEDLSNLSSELDSVFIDAYYNDSSIVYNLAETLYRLEYNEINTSIQRDQPIHKFKYDELLKFTEQIQQQAEQYGFQ
jgi:hypothetical protein